MGELNIKWGNNFAFEKLIKFAVRAQFGSLITKLVRFIARERHSSSSPFCCV